MKVIKPQKLGLLTRTYEHKGECFLVLTMAAFFPLDQPSALLSEVAMWKFVAGELGASGPLDEGLPKPVGEVLVSGHAYPQGGRPQIACQVRVRVGSVDKTLRVVGNRHWDQQGAPSAPEPFSRMPLTFAQAFGGEGYALNPLGKGFAPVSTAQGPLHPLPNVEDPQHLIRSPKDRPPPAGFLPYDVGSPQRVSRAGTYDARWLKTRFPGFADDLQPSYFNTAPQDQWLKGYFQGGESFSLQHLHPAQPLIEGVLPTLSARAFITQQTAHAKQLIELSTRLDSVWLFPHALRGVLLFRALTRVAEDDAADVLHCVAGFEAPGTVRPVQHYEQVLERRLDKKKGYLYALRDDELLPPEALVPSSRDEPAELPAAGELVRAALQRRIELERERGREISRQAGIAPESFLPPPPPVDAPVPTIEELPAFVAKMEAEAEQQQERAQREREEAEKEARAICEQNGIDYEQMMEEARRNSGGPPRFSAREELGKLEQLALACRAQGQPQPELEAMLAAPAFAQKLVRAEASLRDTYRRSAHVFPPAAAQLPEGNARLRAQIEAQLRAGQSLAGEDFTGADLSGMDLSGADLTGVFLERASLRATNLRGANLTQAVLARADLSGANLSGACLKDANLGGALLSGAQLTGGVDLTGAILSSADLRGANLRGAQLTRANLSEARLEKADFREVSAEGTTFLQSNLSHGVFVGAMLSKCNFLECKLEGADFSGATLRSSVFLAAKGDGALFRQAKLGNLRLVQGCSFEKADFEGAELVEANLRGTQLKQSNFAGAALDRADLSECDLREARFHRATAKESRWVRADLQGTHLVSINLMQAILQKANIAGADFTGANLFRADMAKVRGKAASVRDALLVEVRLVQRETK
jgi:uncharacterized protein YjbI with pentapeptide repeats